MGRELGTCRLCDRKRLLTKEHIFPQWLLRDFSVGPLTVLGQSSMGGVLAINELIVRVCGECNAWMNKNFEQPAMPLLRSLARDEERVLTRKQQKRLALWCVKTQLMCDLVMDTQLQFPHKGYVLFRQRPNLDVRTRIWIGKVGKLEVVPDLTSVLIDHPPDELLAYGSYSRGFGFGSIFVKLARIRGTPPPTVLNHRWFHIYLRQISPFVAPLDWPPKWVMNQDMTEILHNLLRISPRAGKPRQRSVMSYGIDGRDPSVAANPMWDLLKAHRRSLPLEKRNGPWYFE